MPRNPFNKVKAELSIAPHPQNVIRIEKIKPLLSLTKDQLERQIQEFLSVVCRLALHRCTTLKLSNPFPGCTHSSIGFTPDQHVLAM